MTRLRTNELRNKEKSELLKTLSEHKKELSQLRVAQQVSGTATKLGKINVMRKNVARVLTVLNQTEKANLKKFYAGKKWQPKVIRAKLTKRRRQALTHKEARSKTRKQIRAKSKFPMRVFAVKL